MAERLGMVIDMKGCVACASCAVACKVENNLPDGVWWNRILTDGGDNPDTPAGAYPNLTMENIAVACQHCENPDRKSTRLNSSHIQKSRMPSSA